jgi:hypothetical protein
MAVSGNVALHSFGDLLAVDLVAATTRVIDRGSSNVDGGPRDVGR